MLDKSFVERSRSRGWKLGSTRFLQIEKRITAPSRAARDERSDDSAVPIGAVASHEVHLRRVVIAQPVMIVSMGRLRSDELLRW